MIPLSWKITLVAVIGVAIAGFLGWTAIKAFPAKYAEMARRVEKLEHQRKLDLSKIAAYQRAQERRDAAIKASPCKAQIQHWIKNPDKIPGQFNPFEQLTPPNLREGAEKAPPPDYSFDMPDFSLRKLNPFNWF